jgi:hypothetical protein
MCIEEGENHLDLTDIDLTDNSFIKDESHSFPDETGILVILRRIADEIKVWLRVQPLYIIVSSMTLGIAVIVAGAIIFFVLIGATPYYSTDVNDQLVEISSQILNAIFTLLCALIAPSRVLSFYHYLYLKFGFNQEKTNFTQCLLTSFPWAAESLDNSEIDQSKLSSLGMLIFFQNMHCSCQWVVAYFMWRYGQKTRPLISMLFVALAILLGCGTGILECRLKEKFKSVQTS